MDGVRKIMCEHLKPLESAILAAGFTERYRGQPWTENCREWVYFDCYLDPDKIEQQFELGESVQRYSNDDTRSGRESGFFCELCKDALIGFHGSDADGRPQFPK